tara:strand:+ start:2331 stop:2834 length:504 start_codon:yes stop_codon:yes gene_type:complete
MKWLPTKDFPNYEVSNEGLVRNANTKHILKLNTKKGTLPYKRVHLSHKGIAKYPLVHRLVLIAFVGDCPKGMQCLHADNNPANNNLSNLSWNTPKKNHETIDRKGERNGRAKLTETDVINIRKSQAATRSLAKQYNVSQKYIQNIQRGITWKHIPQDLSGPHQMQNK